MPNVTGRNVAVRITPDAVRQVRGGSPWVYDGSIDSVNFDAPPGAVAVLFDRKREFVGLGLYDPASPIRVKVLTTGERVDVDAAFLSSRVAASIARRAELNASAETNAYRLVHGENDGLPGLVIDRYAATVVAKLYSTIWLPYYHELLRVCVADLGLQRAVVRLARGVADSDAAGLPADGSVVLGEPIDGPIEFREGGIELEADVVAGQKTGHFLDQRENRARVARLAAGTDMLDVFASTGGFSVAAAVAGARSVTLIDQSAPALQTARRNLGRNDTAATTISTIVGDAFAEMDTLGAARATFDIVVVDPPSFAQRRELVDGARAAYERLTALAVRLVRPGGVAVLCSCSSRVSSEEFFDSVYAGARRGHRRLVELDRTGAPNDHPVGFEYGAYLKALFVRVE